MMMDIKKCATAVKNTSVFKPDYGALPFIKMQGLGNDFVMMKGEDIPVGTDQPRLAAYVSDRHFGIGSDGLVIIAPATDPEQFDIQFVFFNSDGSQAEMCGNGIRCFARLVRDLGIIDSDTFRVETPAGLMVPKINKDATVTVDMGAPILDPKRIPFVEGDEKKRTVIQNEPLTVLGQTVPITAVSMGNPHCMIFQEDLAEPLDPAIFGPAIETHPRFPQKTNVEFVDVVDEQTLRLRVWERGCGFTLACGTGACATAVASALNGKTGHSVAIHLPGGILQVQWERETSNHVLMTGPADYVFEGVVQVPQTITGHGGLL